MANKKTKLMREADRLWFEIIMDSKPICEVCGNKANQAHHFFPKHMCAILRYDLDNGIKLCQGCHFSHHHKGDPRIHQTIIQKRGQDWYSILLEASKQKKISFKTIKYYEDIIGLLRGIKERNERMSESNV